MKTNLYRLRSILSHRLPTIACINRATTPLGADFATLVAALQRYVNLYLAPVWWTPARLVRAADFVKGVWAVEFLDDADQPRALAHNELTPHGLPMARVFVKTTLERGVPVSVAASHELAEILVDPALNLMCAGPDPAAAYAYEPASPVEGKTFIVAGFPMSNFVCPEYFEAFRKLGSARFDHMNTITRPFELAPGGYQWVFRNGAWTAVFGSPERAERFAREDRRGQRSAIRRSRGFPAMPMNPDTAGRKAA